MSKSFSSVSVLKNVLVCVFVLCLCYEFSHALRCLKCESSEPDSDCRLGKRMFKPRLQVCVGPHPQCYALAKVDAKGNALFQRGCTIRDVCHRDAPDGLGYCKTCKSQFCNYDVMDIDIEYIDA